MITADMTDTQPQTRTATCEAHGEFESRHIVGKVWTRCPACAREKADREAREEAARARAKRREDWERKLGHACIPERFRTRTLDRFIASTPEQREALEIAKDYAANFQDVMKTGRCLIFLGKPGTGKTHLAVGIGLRIMGAFGHTVLFTTVMRAVRRVKDSWSRETMQTESDAIETLTSPDLLILDEVGIQTGSEFERNILFDILNERYQRRRPTIVMSNLSKDELALFLGERVLDRLREDGGRIIAFTWDSYRARKD